MEIYEVQPFQNVTFIFFPFKIHYPFECHFYKLLTYLNFSCLIFNKFKVR